MSEEMLTLQQWHKKQAVQCFNAVWDLIDQKNRAPEEDLKMIHTAHASRFHWAQIGTALELARGEWQISRVYSLLGMFEIALYHGEYCLRLCRENGIGDFDLAFAYEAIARAYLINKNADAMNRHLELAVAAGNHIAKNEDRQYFFSELNSIHL